MSFLSTFWFGFHQLSVFYKEKSQELLENGEHEMQHGHVRLGATAGAVSIIASPPGGFFNIFEEDEV